MGGLKTAFKLKGEKKMAFNEVEYLEMFDRDYDYYLFWAEEFQEKHWDDLCECQSLMKMQITCSHIIMDQYCDSYNYQEDGFILGEIIWATLQQIRKEKGGQ